MLKLYNTLTRKKEVFKPIRKNFVGMYGCGPTVYWHQHIGGMRRYIFEDILYRTLKYKGFKIEHIINVTDVGHLTSDADEGEDKVEVAAKKEGKSAKEITHYYFDEFEKDLKKLNVTMPDKWTWASDYIKEMVVLIKKIEKKNYTYKTSDGIYFDTSKFKDYGKLAKIDISGLQAGKRIKIGEKKNKTDFALWKFSEKQGERQQEWNSPWGIGFPGWHLECSAMSSKYLGKQFDIHTGGIDNMNPHHINEIAQSETAFGKRPWVKYWLHNNHLNLKEGKMSKSTGQIIRLKNLEEKGYLPMEFRYLCLLTHYRKIIRFDFKEMNSAKESYQRLKNIISGFEDDDKLNKHHGRTPKDFDKKSLQGAKYLKEFEEAIEDDLNVPRALQVLWKLVRDKKAQGKIQTIKKMDEVFGLDLLKIEKIKIPKEVKKLVEEREESRKKKDFGKSDELRDKIKKKGFIVEDVDEGSRVRIV